MSTAFTQPAAANRSPDMGIAWETLPSLSHLVGRNAGERRDAPAWQETRPLDLDALFETDAFHEPLEGLDVREVSEPEIFEALFGGVRRA